MILATKTEGKITVNFHVDKLSEIYFKKDGNGNNSLVYFDESMLYRELHLLKKAGKKGIFNFTLTAASAREKNTFIAAQNKWVNDNYTPIKSGGIFTMLKNKGY